MNDDFFYVLLTVHLSIILVINQLNAQILLISTTTNAHVCALVGVLIK